MEIRFEGFDNMEVKEGYGHFAREWESAPSKEEGGTVASGGVDIIVEVCPFTL